MSAPDASARTALTRTKLSAPATFLLEQELLVGRILDFGCGKGDLAKFLDGDIIQYDPNHHPKKPKGTFDIVTCNYVLNVLSSVKRRLALSEAKEYVAPGGCLYIAVRRDPLPNGCSKIGTRQYDVRLRLPSLVHRRGAFEIYKWTTND